MDNSIRKIIFISNSYFIDQNNSYTSAVLYQCRYCLTLVFGKLLQKDMEEFVKDWNSHLICPNQNIASPNGRPNDIYDMPSIYGMLKL